MTYKLTVFNSEHGKITELCQDHERVDALTFYLNFVNAHYELYFKIDTTGNWVLLEKK